MSWTATSSHECQWFFAEQTNAFALPAPSLKIAAFDLDDTLIRTKSRAPYYQTTSPTQGPRTVQHILACFKNHFALFNRKFPICDLPRHERLFKLACVAQNIVQQAANRQKNRPSTDIVYSERGERCRCDIFPKSREDAAVLMQKVKASLQKEKETKESGARRQRE